MVWNQWLSDEQNIANKQEEERNAAIGLAAFAVGYAAVQRAFDAHRGERPKNAVDSFFDGLAGIGYGFIVLFVIMLVIGWIF